MSSSAEGTLIEVEGHTKSVSSDELETASHHGWRLRAIVHEDRFEERYEDVPDPHDRHRVRRVVKHETTRRACFIVERAAEVGRWEETIASLEHELYSARSDLRSAEKLTEAAEEKCELATKHAAADLARLEEASKRLSDGAEAHRRMERRLAKAREHFGAKQWAEFEKDGS